MNTSQPSRMFVAREIKQSLQDIFYGHPVGLHSKYDYSLIERLNNLGNPNTPPAQNISVPTWTSSMIPLLRIDCLYSGK